MKRSLFTLEFAKQQTLFAILSLVAVAPVLASASSSPIESHSIANVTVSPTWNGASAVAGTDKAQHLTDGVEYSSWVGDPAQGAVELHWAFVGMRYISEVDITPGCAGSNRTFSEFSRPKQLVLRAGEREVSITLRDRRRTQTVRFDPPLRARRATLTVKTSYPGKHEGICLTEVTYKEQDSLQRVDAATRTLIDRNVSLLGTDDGPQAVVMLEAVGPAAIPALVYSLKTGDFDTQRAALEVFRRLGSSVGSQPLITFWESGPAPELVPLTLGALAATGSLEALKLVSSLIQSEDFDLADAAANASGAFGPAVIPYLAKLLRSDYDDVVERSLRTLSKIKSPAVVQLAAPYVNARFSSWRTAAAKALAGSGSVTALSHLRKLSNDPHPSVRVAIATYADSFPPGEGQAILARLARDDDEAVARRALHNLAKTNNGISHLADYLRADVAPLGNEAIALLAQSRSRLALQIMIDALARGEARFRSSLRDGVESYGATGVSALFTASLEDQRLKVDARALLEKFPNLALKLVGPLLERNPTGADLDLVETLGRTRAVGSLQVLDHIFGAGSLSGKIAVVKSWAHYPAAAISSRVFTAMRSSEPLVRRQAAIAASQAGVRAISPLLHAALKDGSIAPEIVVAALGRLKDTSAENYMIERFRDGDSSMALRLAVLQACKDLQTSSCTRLLFSAANDSNLTVRHEAMLLLGADDRLAQR
ncbi:MAG: hypothetical protein VX223_05065 [Myxococcota bacterium]|nr:hypothetical protein [Myxococcota bacterium]